MLEPREAVLRRTRREGARPEQAGELLNAQAETEPATRGPASCRAPRQSLCYGFETTSDFVPPKLELPFTVETVNVTDPTRFGMPPFDTAH